MADTRPTKPRCYCWHRAAQDGWGPAIRLDPSPMRHDPKCEDANPLGRSAP